jgi:hypothetical protein
MSQGKLNAIPPGTGGIAGQLANSQTSDAIAQQGMASAQPTPPIGTMPGTFGRPGGSVQQPALAQFDGIGATAPVAPMPMPSLGPGGFGQPGSQVPGGYIPGGEISTMENKYPMGPLGDLLKSDPSRFISQPGGSLRQSISTPFNPGNMYTGGVNTPAPEDELGALPGPDNQGGGY